jgi:hypothetical protein
MALVQDSFGMVPLHHAVRRGCEIDALSVLVHAAPAAATIVNHNGQTPLRMAIDLLVSEEIIQTIVEPSQKTAVEIATSLGVTDWCEVLAVLETRRDERQKMISVTPQQNDDGEEAWRENKTVTDAEILKTDAVITEQRRSSSEGEVCSYFGPATVYSSKNTTAIGELLAGVSRQQSLLSQRSDWIRFFNNRRASLCGFVRNRRCLSAMSSTVGNFQWRPVGCCSKVA